MTDPATGKTAIAVSASGEHCCGQRIGPNIARPVVQTFVESPKVTCGKPLRRETVTHVSGMKWPLSNRNGPKLDGGQGRNRTTDTRIFKPRSLLLGA